MQVHDTTARFQGGFTKARKRTSYLVVHHAAALYAQAGDYAVYAVDLYHRQNRGWPGIGYHEALVEMPDGSIACYVLSDPTTERAHIYGRNHESWGISCLTNFDNKTRFPNGKPTQKWIDALAERLRLALDRWPRALIKGHKDIALPGYGTDCPGKRWLDWQGDLIHAVNGRQTRRFVIRYGDTPAHIGTDVRSPIAWDGTCKLPRGFALEGALVKGVRYTATSGALKGTTSDAYIHWPAAGFIWAPLARTAT